MTDDCRECRAGRHQALNEFDVAWRCMTHGVVRLEPTYGQLQEDRARLVAMVQSLVAMNYNSNTNSLLDKEAQVLLADLTSANSDSASTGGNDDAE